MVLRATAVRAPGMQPFLGSASSLPPAQGHLSAGASVLGSHGFLSQASQNYELLLLVLHLPDSTALQVFLETMKGRQWAPHSSCTLPQRSLSCLRRVEEKVLGAR